MSPTDTHLYGLWVLCFHFCFGDLSLWVLVQSPGYNYPYQVGLNPGMGTKGMRNEELHAAFSNSNYLVDGISLLSHASYKHGWLAGSCEHCGVYHPLTIALFTAPKNMGTWLLSETARKLTSYFSKALSQNHDHQKTSLATPSNVCYMSLQCATSYFCTQNHCHRTMTTRRPA